MSFPSSFSPSNRPARLNRKLTGFFPPPEVLEEQRRISRARKISLLLAQPTTPRRPRSFDISKLTSPTNKRSPARRKPRNRVNSSHPRQNQRQRKASSPDEFECDSGFLPAVPSFGAELVPREDPDDKRKMEVATYWDALRPEIDYPDGWSIFRLTSEIYIIEDWDRKNTTLQVPDLS